MSTLKRSKAAETADDSHLIAGIQKHLPNTSILLAGTSYTGPSLVKIVQARIDSVNATITTRAAFQAAVKAEKEELLQTQEILSALKKTLYAMFTDVATLADFGLSPYKKPDITPAERVASVAKAKATRVARHTMGSKQKKGVTGSVASPSAPTSSGPSPVTPPVKPV